MIVTPEQIAAEKAYAAERDLYNAAVNASLYGTQPGDFSEAEPIVVTDEMLAVADETERALADPYTSQEYFTAIYRAMAAVEPLVPNLPARLTAERDAALARAEAAERRLDERDNILMAQMTELTRANSGWLRALARAEAAEKRLAADDTQPRTDVDKVIDQLDRRVVGAPERTKLRGALDKADAPDKSRTGQDAAVGRALRLGV